MSLLIFYFPRFEKRENSVSGRLITLESGKPVPYKLHPFVNTKTGGDEKYENTSLFRIYLCPWVELSKRLYIRDNKLIIYGLNKDFCLGLDEEKSRDRNEKSIPSSGICDVAMNAMTIAYLFGNGTMLFAGDLSFFGMAKRQKRTIFKLPLIKKVQMDHYRLFLLSEDGRLFTAINDNVLCYEGLASLGRTYLDRPRFQKVDGITEKVTDFVFAADFLALALTESGQLWQLGGDIKAPLKPLEWRCKLKQIAAVHQGAYVLAEDKGLILFTESGLKELVLPEALSGEIERLLTIDYSPFAGEPDYENDHYGRLSLILRMSSGVDYVLTEEGLVDLASKGYGVRETRPIPKDALPMADAHVSRSLKSRSHDGAGAGAGSG